MASSVSPARRAAAGQVALAVESTLRGFITDEGAAFDGQKATGLMPVAHRVAGVRSFRRS